MRYKAGDVVRWKTTFGGALIKVETFIPGAGGAYLGWQQPEGFRTVFFQNEVEPVEVADLAARISASKGGE